MRDFQRDWRRWTRAERVAFVMLALVMVATVPAAFGASIHAAPVATNHIAGRLS